MTAAHEHTWVNTPSGVTCTTCPAKIEAPECDHTYRLDRIEAYAGSSSGSLRKAILVCTECEYEQGRLTNRTDDEIAAEVAAANG